MEFKQCIFRTYNGEPDAELAGISVYRYGKLIGVICLCCGGWNSARRVKILGEAPGWLDLGTYMYRSLEMAEEWDDDDDD